MLNSYVTCQVPFAPLGMDPSKLMSKRRRSSSPGKEKPNPDLAGKGLVCSAEPHFQMGDEPEEWVPDWLEPWLEDAQLPLHWDRHTTALAVLWSTSLVPGLGCS